MEDKQNFNGPKCPRCAAPLTGPECQSCGFRLMGPQNPDWYSYRAPVRKRHTVRNAVLISLAVLLGLGMLAGGFIVLAGVTRPLSEADSSRIEDFYDEPPYEYTPYLDYGFTNESFYLRVDSLGSTRSDGGELAPAPQGKQYLVVNLHITNISDEIVPYDAASFELSCGNGNLLPSVQTGVDASTALGYGRLLPGGTVDGSVVFLIPEGKINLVLYLHDEWSQIRFPLI